MAAPTPVARTKPTGRQIPDGYKTLIAFTSHPGANFWENEVKPPSYDGGEKIPLTSMFNDEVRTFHPRALYENGDVTATGGYDPDILSVIPLLLNKNQPISVIQPDDSSVTFWGYLKSWDPASNKEGEHPTATITVVVTNYDEVNNVEAKPVYTPASGT